MLRRVAGVILSLGLVAACGDDAGDDRSAVTSIPDETTTSSTTTEPRIVAPDVIPEESQITDEYVEAVLDELYRASSAAIRASVEAGELTQETIDVFDAIHTLEASVTQVENLVDAELEGFSRYRADPGQVRAAVVRVVEARPDCVVAEVSLDASEILATPPETSSLRTALQLVPAEQEQRASGLNPTAWVIADSAVTDDGNPPELPCG